MHKHYLFPKCLILGNKTYRACTSKNWIDDSWTLTLHSRPSREVCGRSSSPLLNLCLDACQKKAYNEGEMASSPHSNRGIGYRCAELYCLAEQVSERVCLTNDVVITRYICTSGNQNSVKHIIPQVQDVSGKSNRLPHRPARANKVHLHPPLLESDCCWRVARCCITSSNSVMHGLT